MNKKRSDNFESRAELCITAIYAMLTNVDMLKSGVNLVKSRLGK